MSSKVAFQVHYGDFYRITRDFYRKKNVVNCVEQTVTLTRSAHSFQYPLLLPRLDLPGIDGWIGSTYKNSPHLVVHATACNVFVCTKLSILCIYYV